MSWRSKSSYFSHASSYRENVASARRVVFDPLQLVVGMVGKHHDGEQGYVGYRLQNYSRKEPVNGTPDNFSGRFSGNFAGTTDRPECLKRFFCFSGGVSFLQSHP